MLKDNFAALIDNVLSNGDQSYLTVLAGTPSAVQRSWGTIKSMFR